MPARERFVAVDPVYDVPGGKRVITAGGKQIAESHTPPKVFHAFHCQKLCRHNGDSRNRKRSDGLFHLFGYFYKSSCKNQGE